MKREERIEGTSFTRRRKVNHRTETDEELFDGLQKQAQWSRDPWGAQNDIFEWVRRAFEVETRGKKRPYGFRPHEDAGWYLDELQIAIQTANTNIEKGDPHWAAYAGAKFGELWSEFQLKLAREELYCRALEHSERRKSDASAPPGTHEKRAARVQHHLDQGDKLTEAYANAAADLSIGVSTVRRSWAIVRNGAGDSG